jgi:hypothetical protein
LGARDCTTDTEIPWSKSEVSGEGSTREWEINLRYSLVVGFDFRDGVITVNYLTRFLSITCVDMSSP